MGRHRWQVTWTLPDLEDLPVLNRLFASGRASRFATWALLGRAAFLGLLASVSCTPIAIAGAAQDSRHSRDFPHGEQKSIEATVQGYFRAFTAKDWSHLDQYLTAPFVELGPAPRYLPTFADVLSVWRHVREPLDGTDYALSRAVRITVTPLTAQSALVDVYWQRLTKSGGVMQEGAEYYLASRNRDGAWRLNGHLDQDLALYQGPR
jgi:hypothetical protein